MKTHFKLKHDETFEIVESPAGVVAAKACLDCVFMLDSECVAGSVSYCRRGVGAHMKRPIIQIVKVTK